MTTGEQLLAVSILNTGTARDLLLNPSGEGGSGVDVAYPIESFSVNLVDEEFTVNLDIITISADLENVIYDTNLVVDEYTANIIMENYNVNNPN